MNGQFNRRYPRRLSSLIWSLLLIVALAQSILIDLVSELGTNELAEWDPAIAELAALPSIRHRFPNDADRLVPALAHVVRQGFARRPLCTPERLRTGALCRHGQKTGPTSAANGITFSWSDEGVSLDGNASHGFMFAFDPAPQRKRSPKSPRPPRLGTSSLLSPSTAWFSIVPQVYGLVEGSVVPLDCNGPASNVVWKTYAHDPVPDAVTFAGSCSIIFQEALAGTLAYNLTVFDLNKPVSMQIRVQHPVIAGDVSTLFVVSPFVVSSDTAQGSGLLCLERDQSSGAGSRSSSCALGTQSSEWSEPFSAGHFSDSQGDKRSWAERVTAVHWKSPTTDFFLRSDTNASSDGGVFSLLLDSARFESVNEFIYQNKVSGRVNVTCAGSPDGQATCFRKFDLHFASLIDEWIEDYFQATSKLRLESRVASRMKAASSISSTSLLVGDYLHGDIPSQTKLASLMEGFAFSIPAVHELDLVVAHFEHESLHLNVLHQPRREPAGFDFNVDESAFSYARDFPSGWLCPPHPELALRTLCHVGTMHSLQTLLFTHEASDESRRYALRIQSLIARGSQLVLDLFRYRPAALFFRSRHGSKLCEALAKVIATARTHCHLIYGCWFLHRSSFESLTEEHCAADLFPQGALYDFTLSEGNRTFDHLIKVLSFISSEERIATSSALGYPTLGRYPQFVSTPVHAPPVFPPTGVDPGILSNELNVLRSRLVLVELSQRFHNQNATEPELLEAEQSDSLWALLDPGRKALRQEECIWVNDNAKYLELLLLPQVSNHAQGIKVVEKVLDFLLTLHSVASIEGVCFPAAAVQQQTTNDVRKLETRTDKTPNEKFFRAGANVYKGSLFSLEQRLQDFAQADYVSANHSHVVVVLELSSAESQSDVRSYSLEDLCEESPPFSATEGKSCRIIVTETGTALHRSVTISATGTLEAAPGVRVMNFNYTVVISSLDHSTRHIVDLSPATRTSDPNSNRYTVVSAEVQMYRDVQHNTTHLPPPILCLSEMDGRASCNALKMERILWDEWAQEFKWYLTNQQGSASPLAAATSDSTVLLLHFPQWNGDARTTQVSVKPESLGTWSGWSVPAFSPLQHELVKFATHYRCKWTKSAGGATEEKGGDHCVVAERRYITSNAKLNLVGRDPFKSYPPQKSTLAAVALRDMARRPPNPYLMSNRLDGATLSSLASGYLLLNCSGYNAPTNASHNSTDGRNTTRSAEDGISTHRRRCPKLQQLIQSQLSWLLELLPRPEVENDELLVDVELPHLAFAVVALNTMFAATGEMRYLFHLEESMSAFVNMLLPDGRVFRCSHHVSQGSVDCQLAAFFALSRLLATFPFGLSQKAELTKEFLAKLVHRIGLTTVSLRFDDNRKLQIVVEGQGWDNRPTYSRCGLILRTLVALERAAHRFSGEELHQFTTPEYARLQALRQVCQQALHEASNQPPPSLPLTPNPSPHSDTQAARRWRDVVLGNLDDARDAANAWAWMGVSAEASETQLMYSISARHTVILQQLRVNRTSSIEVRNDINESETLLRAYTRYRRLKGSFQSAKRRGIPHFLPGARTPPNLKLAGGVAMSQHLMTNTPLHSRLVTPSPKSHHKSLPKASSHPDDADDYHWKIFLLLNVAVILAAVSWLSLLQWRKSKNMK